MTLAAILYQGIAFSNGNGGLGSHRDGKVVCSQTSLTNG